MNRMEPQRMGLPAGIALAFSEREDLTKSARGVSEMFDPGLTRNERRLLAKERRKAKGKQHA